ncbi:GGDEF domain-containing protein [Bacterioplanes sanyensis]|uniref:GGDEF domain-containing protein n=1 Tax=Bacterioplanes sanyensis TaxID=1249553 RepID=UPI0012FDDCFE|nr:GGDEF domain-containing protein [Bacterioplanes sanyensis]
MQQLQRDILRRHWYAAVWALSYTILLCLGHYLDLSQLTDVQLWRLVAGYWLLQVALLAMVASGYSRRYKDPSLTIPFMLLSIAFLSLFLWMAPAMRPLLVLGYVTVLPFGMFQLTWRGFLAVTLVTVACYGSVLALLQGSGRDFWQADLEWLLAVAFAASLFCFVVVAREFTQLRDAHRNKNRELRQALARIEELAVTDELTGLYNRRYLLRGMEKHAALADREGLSFVAVFIDIDHFKHINDSHGHSIGDQVLAELAMVLRRSVREADMASRYGGEEFVLLLSGVDLVEAAPVLERIRQVIIDGAFSEQQLPLTVSMGVAQFRVGECVEKLLARADHLLYEAKRRGRNRIEMEALAAINAAHQSS